jgi:Cd2+/Zn2+-exporting ATPase
MKTSMLTEGHPAHRRHRTTTGIKEVLGDLRPIDRLKAIEALRPRCFILGMLGDGINEAPALAKAETGVAMAGAGTAIKTVNVALMDDDLRNIPAFIRLSQQTPRLPKQNIILALGLAITLTGLATMWMAVFANMGASIEIAIRPYQHAVAPRAAARSRRPPDRQ